MSSIPRSLVHAKTLAPWLMAATGILTILQFLVLSEGEFVPVIGAFAIPTLGTTALGFLLARRRWAEALVALVAIPIVHVIAVTFYSAIAGTGAGNDIGWVAMVVDGVTFVLAFPALVACAVQGPRADHDAGDVLLGVGGAWFAVEQGLCLAVAWDKHELWTMFAAGLALAVVALLVAIGRSVHRRAWTSRVARGLVSGWRVSDASLTDARGLVPLFGGHTALAVLERFEVGTTAYRSAPIAEPVALVPVR